MLVKPKKIAKETTISFIGIGFGDASRYLFTVILARFVGVEFIGIYSLANAVTRIGEVFGRAGLHSGVMRFVSRLDKETEQETIKERISSGLKLGILFSIVVTVVQIVFSKWLAFDLFNGSELLHQVLIISAISLPFATIMSIAAFATQGYQLLKYKVIVLNIIRPLVMLGSVLFCIGFLTHDDAVKYPLLISAAFSAIVALAFLKKLTRIKLSQIFSSLFDTELLSFSFPLMFVTILGTLMHWMDIIMLGYFTDTSTVGLYHPATRSAGLLRTVLVAFMGIFAPTMAALYHRGDYAEMGKLYKLTIRWIISLSLPIAIIVILYAKKVMLLFGGEYIDAADSLMILILAAFMQTVFGGGGDTLTMAGFTKINMLNSILAVSINIILNIIWIPQFGIMGAAYATLVSMTTLGGLRLIEVLHFIKIDPFSIKLLKPLLAGVVMTIVLFLIKPMIMPLHTILSLIIVFLIGFLSFFIILWLLKFDADDKEVWSGIRMIANKK